MAATIEQKIFEVNVMTVKERDEHLLDLLKDIISSSDANCGDSLANAICAAKDAVYSIEGDKPTEPPVQVFDPIDACDT